MNKDFLFVLVFPVFLVFALCSNKQDIPKTNNKTVSENKGSPLSQTDNFYLTGLLDNITEIERSGNYYSGLGMTESGIKEKDNDYPGAVVSVFKELSYQYAWGQISKDELKEKLKLTLHIINNNLSDTAQKESAIKALYGIESFLNNEWQDAISAFTEIKRNTEEADSFLNYMILVCKLELSENKINEYTEFRSLYSSIRARYAVFPEYWYRLSCFYSKEDNNFSALYAEQCINIISEGPYAAFCRKIIAQKLGLSENKNGIKTKTEIDKIVTRSLTEENPELLKELFVLLSLPDNTYTHYAVTLLKNLSVIPLYKYFYEDEAVNSESRLAERLNFICRI